MPAEGIPVSGENEVDMVLKALGDLQGKVANPVIRACLEDVYQDIAHLVGSGEPVEKPC
jgi:hypothetical protein